ncbi:MAG: hypothetical protein KDA58_15425 [Planctomycetaceae bacterium]|nr:hypothetical protein [Planctomycetaceae bacterium]
MKSTQIMLRLVRIYLAIFTCSVLLGCGGDGRPSLVQATGRVTLNGEPLEGASVSFVPVEVADATFQRPSFATTNAQGEFTIGTYGSEDGIPAGKYQVGIQKREVVGALPKDFNEEEASQFRVRYKLIVPLSYRDPAASGVTVEVTSDGMQPAVIELNSSGNPEFETTGPGGGTDV